MSEAFVQRVARGIDDVDRCIEIGFSDLEMNDVASFGFQRPRLHQYFEGSLSAQTRHALREAEFTGLSHDGEISIIAALAQLVFFIEVAILNRVSFQICG